MGTQEEIIAGHTPTPWRVKERSGYCEILAACPDTDWYGEPKTHAVAYADTELDEQQANAAFIVRACNGHSALVEALNACLNFLDSAPLESGICCCGDPIEGHGYHSGHSPVDDLQYHAAQIAELARAALSDHGSE